MDAISVTETRIDRERSEKRHPNPYFRRRPAGCAARARRRVVGCADSARAGAALVGIRECQAVEGRDRELCFSRTGPFPVHAGRRRCGNGTDRGDRRLGGQTDDRRMDGGPHSEVRARDRRLSRFGAVAAGFRYAGCARGMETFFDKSSGCEKVPEKFGREGRSDSVSPVSVPQLAARRDVRGADQSEPDAGS